MAKFDTISGRVIINEYLEGIEVIVSAKKSSFVNFFLALWMTGWVYGENLIIGKAFNHSDKSPDAFLVFWLVGWTFGGFFAFIMWLHNTRGREIVRVSENELRYTRDFVLFARSKIYETNKITNLRVFHLIPTMDSMREGMEFWGLSGGSVAFDYRLSIHKFGLGLEEPDARHIIDVLGSRFKFLQPP